MKTHLLWTDRDLDMTAEMPWQGQALIEDLELDVLLDAMAAGDDLIREVSRRVLLHGLDSSEAILYRQQVLEDCLRQPDAIREMYDAAGQALESERSVYLGFFTNRPEPMLTHAVGVLDRFIDHLLKLRTLAQRIEPDFSSPGFTTLFGELRDNLTDEWFAQAQEHVKELKFRHGILMSIRLAPEGRSTDHVLRLPAQANNSFFGRIGVRKPSHSYTVPDRDEGGLHALSDLRDKGLSAVAVATEQACDYVRGFWTALRRELGFYLGCIRVRARLAALGMPACYPRLAPAGAQGSSASDLYDISLALGSSAPVTANSFDAADCPILVVTGANQGGKSTFIRSLGLAQLMSGAGMFVAARELTTPVHDAVFTHFLREEDTTMVSGKLDEELVRMSAIADHVTARSMLLCNESFQSTNEREGSQIALDVIDAMADAGVQLGVVTHLYELAHQLYEDRERRPAYFLRAGRTGGAGTPYELHEDPPEPTSFGQDVYDRIVGPGSPDAAGDEQVNSAPGQAPAGVPIPADHQPEQAPTH